MRAHGFVRNLRTLLIGISPVVVAACGGGNVSIGGGSSSSGGTGSSTFHGTFFGYTGNSQLIFPAPSTQKDLIFGVVASDGNGFFADSQTAGSQAIFNLAAASSTGSSAVSGFFNAYTATGSALGDGTLTAINGGLSGTLSSTSSSTQAALSFAYPSGSYSNTANIILDTPALTPASIPTGTYSASAGTGTGTAAIASSAISNNTADTYTVNFTSATSFTLSSVSGCNFSGSTVAADGTFNVYLLSGVTGSCPKTAGTITLTGVASFLPANGHSPLGGVLAKNTLVLELDDSNSSNTPKQYALALVATQQ